MNHGCENDTKLIKSHYDKTAAAGCLYSFQEKRIFNKILLRFIWLFYEETTNEDLTYSFVEVT